MGIRFLCPTCSRKLNIKAHLAGKRGICPHCQAKILIPQDNCPSTAAPIEKPMILADGPANPSPPTAVALPLAAPQQGDPVGIPSLATSNSSTGPSEPVPSVTLAVELPRVLTSDPQANWYVGTSDGRQFGPADAARMWQWLGEGRVPADSLVWREGWEQWRPVRDVFPQSAPTHDPVPSPPPLQTATNPELPVASATPELPVASAIPLADGSLASVSTDSPGTAPSLVAGQSALEGSSAQRRLRSRRRQWRLTTTAVLIVLFVASILLIAVLFYVLAVGPIETATRSCPAKNGLHAEKAFPVTCIPSG